MADHEFPTTDLDLTSDLAANISQTVVALFSGGTVAETLAQVADLAVSTIEGCDYAGIFLLAGGDQVTTPVHTDPTVAELDLLQQTSGLLSDLTSYAAVVVAPRHETAQIRSVQLIALGQHLALLVVVLADGTVEKRAIDLDEETSPEVLSAVSAHLAHHLEGRRMSDRAAVPRGSDPRLDPLVDQVNQALADLSAPEESEHVFVGGSSRVAMAFDAVETVRAVLATLERQMVVVSLLRDVLDQGLSVAIGTEHGYHPLASCAVVVAPLNVGGHEDGAVGLLGPTRMNYPQALAAAHVVGERLGERLGDTFGTSSEDPGGPSGPRRTRRGARGGR